MCTELSRHVRQVGLMLAAADSTITHHSPRSSWLSILTDNAYPFSQLPVHKALTCLKRHSASVVAPPWLVKETRSMQKEKFNEVFQRRSLFLCDKTLADSARCPVRKK